MIDIIKDYLISVGMQVDKQSFSQADKAIKDVDKGLGKFANSALGKFVKVGAGASALALAVGTAMGKFASSVAEADRQVGLLAKRLYTTKENARSLTVAMKQMGVSSLDQLREMALDPESRQQFLELKSLANSLENPKTQQALREIRQINHEWRKLMVRFEYFKLEVASQILKIFKEMRPTIQKIIDWFKPIVSSLISLKDSFKEALPNIIKGVKYFWQLLKPILNTIRATVIFVSKMFQLIFKGIRDLPLAFKTAFQVLKFVLDPIIKIFRFIEDLMVYLGGGKSYREKLFDKIPLLYNIRNSGGDADAEEPTPQEAKSHAKSRVKNAWGTKSYKWGENVGGFKAERVKNAGTSTNPRYIPYKDMLGYNLKLSEENIKALESIGNTLGTIANKFKISSGYELGHSEGSLHHVGKAVDLGFAGTGLSDQVRLIKAVLNDAHVSRALLEVDAQTKNNIYNQLKGEDLSKLAWKNTPRASNHLHIETQQPETQPQNNNITFNITSTDPKESMAEADRYLNILFGKGKVTPK
jgi:hypothetical protein